MTPLIVERAGKEVINVTSRAERGFSLAELLVGIAIITILAAILCSVHTEAR